MDDILVSGISEKDHYFNELEDFFKQLASADLRLWKNNAYVHGTSSNMPGSQGQQGRYLIAGRQGRRHRQCNSC